MLGYQLQTWQLKDKLFITKCGHRPQSFTYGENPGQASLKVHK